MEAGAKLLVRYQWNHGKFIAAYVYNSKSIETEERNW
jgi:hypothetical protein